jgi:hypothetical protein
MSTLFFHKNFGIFFFLYFISTPTITAQESNIYNEILKESMKMDFMKIVIPLETDSNLYKEQVFKNIDEENFYRVLFRHRIEFLLPKENLFQPEKEIPQLSYYAKAFYYTNYKENPLDKKKFNGDGTFSGEFALKESSLMSKGARVMVNVPGLILFLVTQTNIIPNESLNVKKESKKEKMLRTITKDVYHIDD